jgi:hypothetical protein
MGRGLSELQKTILRRALSNKEREGRSFDEETKADVFVNEIAADAFGWTLPAHYYDDPRFGRWGEHFESWRYSDEERNCVHSATSRSLKRLEARGLGYVVHGSFFRWCGFNLTPAGVEAAKPLSVNDSRVPSQPSFDPDDPRYVAYHEAGYAVAAVVVGLDLKLVDVRPCTLPNGRPAGGFTRIGIHNDDIVGKGEEAALPHLVQSMAGIFAECQVNPHPREWQEAAGDDMEDMRRVARLAICESVREDDGQFLFTPEGIRQGRPRMRALRDRAMAATVQLIDEHWPAIEQVAARLLERGRLTGAEVATIVAANRRPSDPTPPPEPPAKPRKKGGK